MGRKKGFMFYYIRPQLVEKRSSRWNPVFEERYRKISGNLWVMTVITTGKIFVAEKPE
ncbi:MAG TPA: hypothetical protein P5320_07950 [Bacteroidales bacterium]|nr:hypothetical protein [Bacteroidales bacterium]HOK75632.1 hypothetical protein [Bacteroidales bacterium]HOM40119.1 hypothetical protein [Bacteroidales bacterium]HPP93255.1 hypothetical protein [Bacteroidales bacterium]HRR16644.1 hypothetical protein [Bacteroidales bacterium]